MRERQHQSGNGIKLEDDGAADRVTFQLERALQEARRQRRIEPEQRERSEHRYRRRNEGADDRARNADARAQRNLGPAPHRMLHRLGQVPDDHGSGERERNERDEGKHEGLCRIFGKRAGDQRAEPKPCEDRASAQARRRAAVLAKLDDPGGACARGEREGKPAQ